MSILPELKQRFHAALAGIVEDPTEMVELVRRSQDPKFGDYQANMAMPLAKRLGRSPRQVAAEIVARLDVTDLCAPPEIAGPGFINLRIRDDWLVQRLSAAVGDPRLGIAPVAKPRTFVIDFSAPNVAKPMHVGHIRSTVIGDALCRVLRFLGHTAISDNHIGDWGTQFGMILYGYKNFLDADAYRRNPVEELARLYRHVRKLVDQEEISRGDEGDSPVFAETKTGTVPAKTGTVPAKTGTVPARRLRDTDLSAHDRVEVFLDIDRDYCTYYRLTVDHRGWTNDSCWGDATWNPGWFVAVRHEKGQWTAEAAIPFADLIGRPPQPRDVWDVGVQRVAPGVGFQSWTTPAAVAVLPDGFGYLVFQ
jgi:arginyl-tRNA synthetase